MLQHDTFTEYQCNVPIPANMQKDLNAGRTVVAPIKNAQTSVNDVTNIDTPCTKYHLCEGEHR